MKKNPHNPKTPKSIEDFATRDLGAIFRHERERRRLTLDQVAKRAGRSKSSIGHYENGIRPIHFGTFVKLCSAIPVSPAYVWDRWMESDSFDVLDEYRRKEYHDLIDNMIEYGFSRELDNLLFYFRGLIDREKEIRERMRRQRMIQKDTKHLKDLRGDQEDNGV